MVLKKDISQHQLIEILIKGLHGYILPHAGTTYTGHILAHTLRFKPQNNLKISLFFIYLLVQNQMSLVNIMNTMF